VRVLKYEVTQELRRGRGDQFAWRSKEWEPRGAEGASSFVLIPDANFCHRVAFSLRNFERVRRYRFVLCKLRSGKEVGRCEKRGGTEEPC